MIPWKRDEIAGRQRQGSRGGRPLGFDAVAYKGRNVVERSFALAKRRRGVATRYDKLSLTRRSAIVLAACFTWTKI
ncbi:hypothetical protein BCONGLO52_12830 [Brachybacterium conglomeratum]|uniref:Transposase DDE domain-containing protein n=1 Tax=Brachybacterium conglomeratum TaxID=47846 RepID=A0ABQ5RG87_9MICO|nr:hypothetical protein BCONGLO52_12830 [Brachybacterium conglomeratum]GLK04981.1 hypothetical protein GCM10017597_17810 [Brachybacterium conglomeratum]